MTAEMSDPPPIMAALRVEALEAEFASKEEAAPADTGKAGTIFTAAADAVELTAGSQADGPTPEVVAKPVPHLAAPFAGAASSAASSPTSTDGQCGDDPIARIGGPIEPTYAGM